MILKYSAFTFFTIIINEPILKICRNCELDFVATQLVAKLLKDTRWNPWSIVLPQYVNSCFISLCLVLLIQKDIMSLLMFPRFRTYNIEEIMPQMVIFGGLVDFSFMLYRPIG